MLILLNLPRNKSLSPNWIGREVLTVFPIELGDMRFELNRPLPLNMVSKVA